MPACARIGATRTVRSVGDLTLRELLAGIDASPDPVDAPVTGIAYRSDSVRPGDAFFCIPGFKHDGHDFAADAVARGATAIVGKRKLGSVDVVQAIVDDPRVALAVAADRFYGRPSRELDLIGVTGTNGKTTTTYLVDSVLRETGATTGLLGTVEIRVGESTRKAGRTTPESADLQALLREMVDAGVTAGVMEVSSHAIDLRRVDSVAFAVAAFTNLSQDHLDYHRTMEEYYAVKRRLFTEMDVGRAVVNVDDPAGEELAGEIDAEWTVGFDTRARVRAEGLELSATGSGFDLVVDDTERTRVVLPHAGRYNVGNALVAAGCALAVGVDLADIGAGLEAAPQVPGRLERIECGQSFGVFVDYAHTPDGLDKAIRAVKDVTEGRVITVFGCGGDRDPEKRPAMGSVAARLSDRLVVTSDNPRSEDPVGIILHIEDGIRPVRDDHEVEVDRKRAILRALELADSGDSVLIAGKGHEDYQIFADRTIHFDDREVVREGLGC
jgi:UDP-N-acetylmuramoyl-L-alanyl-D-glutamate--2,6-diaminopimelate ligase